MDKKFIVKHFFACFCTFFKGVFLTQKKNHSTKDFLTRTIWTNMKKIVIGFVLALSVFSLHTGGLDVFATEGEGESGHMEGIIPAPKEDIVQTCGGATHMAHASSAGLEDPIKANEAFTKTYKEQIKRIDLGQKIRGGCVELSDVPFLVIHLIDLCTKLAGTIAVIFLLYAGFQMIISGVSDDREAAKNTIKYALTGLVVSFLAWVIVNLVQVQLTS